MSRTARVEEAVGPSLTPAAAAAVILQGVLGLNIIGVAPVLLGALFERHRLSASGIGLAAMLELLLMGVSAGLAGACLPPRRLRPIGCVCALLLAAADAASAGASGNAVLLLRALAGLPEGVLVWITVGMIARSRTPERWAGVFFTAQTVAQLLLALLFWMLVLPAAGPRGGFLVLAAVSLLGCAAAPLTPTEYGPLRQAEGLSGGPPPRGWLALLATFVFVAGNSAVFVYIQPLAAEAGLSAEVARSANVASLLAQVIGGALATAMAGRVGWMSVFLGGGLGWIGVWLLYAVKTSAPIFIGATALAGLISLIISPFLTPMTIEADPTRRAAMQSAGAQIFGGAAGPLGAAFLVNDAEVRGVLAFAAASLVLGLALMLLVRSGGRRAA